IYLYDVHLFFQAEDGIRDRNVTGVQTCALPISPEKEQSSGVSRTSVWQQRCERTPADLCQQRELRTGAYPAFRNRAHTQHLVLRSEERRVGKEGRCEWGEENSREKGVRDKARDE